MNKIFGVLMLTVLLSAAVSAVAQAGGEPPEAQCRGEAATIVAEPGDGDVVGTPGRDVVRVRGSAARSVRTFGGDDDICGRGGSLEVKAGTGNDRIEMQYGSRREASAGGEPNVLKGGEGDDILSGTLADDRFDGGVGADRVKFFSKSVRADLRAGSARGSGDDRLRSVEILVGTTGDDVLIGSAAANQLAGGHGTDRLAGGPGADRLLGGPDSDRMNGGDGRDYADGRGGRNVCRDVEERVDCESR